jgi:hypothetical protein
MDKEIPINPTLRDDFDNTPNEERSAEEIARWWGRPFIITTTFEENQADQTYEAYCERMDFFDGVADETKEQWQARLEEYRVAWYESFPSGTRYEVRCLDGGAWDRSTWWGAFATLDEAIVCANKPVPDYLAGLMVYNPENAEKNPGKDD